MSNVSKTVSVIAMCCVLLSYTSMRGHAAGDALVEQKSLEDVVLMALGESPDIKIALQKTDQAAFAVDEAKATYYPQIDIFAEGGREYNNPVSDGNDHSGSHTNPSVDATLSINQFIFDGFETQEEVARRKQLTESADIQRVRTEEEIILNTVEVYAAMLQNQKAQRDAQSFLATMEDVEKKLILMVEAGAESEAKLKYVQARLSFARQNKIAIDSALSDARTELEQLIGHYPDFEAKHPSSNFIIIEELEDYYRLAQENNKDILVNVSDKKALEHQLESLYGQEYPRLNALVEFNQNHDVGGEIGRDRNASAMLQMNYRIFDGFAADASRKRVMSQIKEIDLRIEKTTRDLNKSIKALYNQLQFLKNEWLILEQEIEANDDVRRLNQKQFELGEADILELVESEERYFNSKIRQHQIEFDFTQVVNQLKQQTGRLKKEEFAALDEY